MIYLYFFMQKHLGLLLKTHGVFGCKVLASTGFRTLFVHFGVAFQIVFQAIGHIFALCDDANTRAFVLLYLGHEQRIVRTAQDNRIDKGIFLC